jgi:hypothetical protein
MGITVKNILEELKELSVMKREIHIYMTKVKYTFTNISY